MTEKNRKSSRHNVKSVLAGEGQRIRRKSLSAFLNSGGRCREEGTVLTEVKAIGSLVKYASHTHFLPSKAASYSIQISHSGFEFCWPMHRHRFPGQTCEAGIYEELPVIDCPGSIHGWSEQSLHCR